MKYLVLGGEVSTRGEYLRSREEGSGGGWGGGITYGSPRLEVVPMECRGGDYTRGTIYINVLVTAGIFIIYSELRNQLFPIR